MVFNRHKGRKWLAEILDDISGRLEKTTVGWMKTAPEKSKTALDWSARVVRRASTPFRWMSAMFGRTSGSAESIASIESIPPPYTSPTIPPSAVVITPRSGSMTAAKSVVRFQLGPDDGRSSGEASGRPSDASPIAPSTVPPTPEPGTEVSATRARFMNLVRSAIMVNRLIGVGDEARAKVSRSLTDGKVTDPKSAGPVVKPRSSRVAGLVPKLQNMTPTQDIAAHAALVRHMQVSVEPILTFAPVVDNTPQFSPDGKFLATSSWDRTSVIFHVGVCYIYIFLRRKTERFGRRNSLLTAYCCTPLDSLARLRGKCVPLESRHHDKPTFRSPSGSLIMTKLPRAIKIWTQDGVCRKTIERSCPVQSIAWLPHGEGKSTVDLREVD